MLPNLWVCYLLMILTKIGAFDVCVRWLTGDELDTWDEEIRRTETGRDPSGLSKYE